MLKLCSDGLMRKKKERPWFLGEGVFPLDVEIYIKKYQKLVSELLHLTSRFKKKNFFFAKLCLSF